MTDSASREQWHTNNIRARALSPSRRNDSPTRYTPHHSILQRTHHKKQFALLRMRGLLKITNGLITITSQYEFHHIDIVCICQYYLWPVAIRQFRIHTHAYAPEGIVNAALYY